MADDLQVTMSAKGDLERDLKNTIKNVARLEAQLRDLGDATDPSAERDIKRLTVQLDKAYDKSKILSGAVDNLDRNLDQMGASAKTAGDKTQSMGRDLDGAHRRSKSFTAGWGKMIGVVAGVTAAIGAASGAFRFLSDSVNEAREARKAIAQTAAVMKSMGRTEGPAAITRMVDRLEAASGIDGDNLREMTNVLFTFGNVTDDVFVKANELALDLSVSYGKDLSSSAIMVGKALNDPLKGLTALGRVGVQFTAKQSEQIKSMMAVNDVAGAQAIIVKELTKQVGGSAAAQADGIAKAQVAWGNLKEAIGEVLMSVSGGGVDITAALQNMTKWITENKDSIVSALEKIISVTFKIISVWFKAISVWLKIESVVINGVGYIVGAIARLLDVMAFTARGMAAIGLISDDTAASFTGAADSAHNVADGLRGMGNRAGDASRKADQASTTFDRMSRNMDASSKKAQKFKDKLANVGIVIDDLNKKDLNKLNRLLDAGLPGVTSQGGVPMDDTRSPWGAGPALGASGLAAAHAGYASSLGGHQITSGVRAWGLGSARSDHLRGRAMDVRGPRLGSYANAVRASGGYAAFHGRGGSRHLHVVPNTNRPGSQSVAGGDTLHAELHFHGGAPRPFDVRAGVISGMRAVERSRRERGGR